MIEEKSQRGHLASSSSAPLLTTSTSLEDLNTKMSQLMRDNVDLHQESANQRAELDALRQDSADQKVKLRTQQQETDTLRDQVKVLQQRIAEVRYSFHLSFIILIIFSSLKKKFSQSDVEHLLARYETALPNTLITATGEIIAMITVILMLTSRRTSHIRNNICQK